jgi:hypothetical protein
MYCRVFELQRMAGNGSGWKRMAGSGRAETDSGQRMDWNGWQAADGQKRMAGNGWAETDGGQRMGQMQWMDVQLDTATNKQATLKQLEAETFWHVK